MRRLAAAAGEAQAKEIPPPTGGYLSKAQPFQVDQKSRNVLVVRMSADSVAGWERWFLLRSDAHHDNPHCRRDIEMRHLRDAKERDAGIIDIGDLHCLMQSRNDPRRMKGGTLPKDERPAYVDSVIKSAAKDYADYAKRWVMMGLGNHETAVLQNCGTNPTERLVERLNTTTGSTIAAGGYGGWIRFALSRHKSRQSFRYRYFHGAGGGAPVTKGTIQAQRHAVRWPDAHIVHTGHVHNEFSVTHTRDRLSDGDVPYLDDQFHLCTPGYKDEYADGFDGWHVERGGEPKPLGAAWLRFHWDGAAEKFAFDVTRAK